MAYNPATNEWEPDPDYTSGVNLPSQQTQQPAANPWASWSNPSGTPAPTASQAPADYWIPPTANFGNNASGAINQQNPFADPSKPFVQAGTTGGYLDGVGVTIGQGRSLTPEKAMADWNAALASGVPESYARDFLSRNNGDVNRIAESYAGELANQKAEADGRNATTSGGSGQAWGGNWFTDPATAQLEDVIKNQLNGLTNPAASSPQAQLQAFLMKRFQELATSNGYSPDELALLRTQGSEPIEALRTSSQQRELQRTSQAGYLPTSGLTRLNEQENDLGYDKLRTAAQRDLAVQNINERTNRLNQAVQLGQTAFNTQNGVNTNQLQLSTLLQQLPVQSLQQAMGVLNGTTSPNSLASIVAQMTALNQNQQQFNSGQQQALWSNIGAMLAGLG